MDEQTKENRMLGKEKMNTVVERLSSKAAEGDAEACCKLANIYVAYSENVKDYIKAYKLAYKAYKSGNVESAFLLGEMNQFGTGCEKNVVRAKYYYFRLLRLPDLHDRIGQSTITDLYINLGKLYMSDKHKLWGSIRARKYFKKAVDMGDEASGAYLAEIGEHIGEYKRDFFGKSAFCICALAVCIWAFHMIQEKCMPLYQHIYDSVITNAVHVENEEQRAAEKTDVNADTETEMQKSESMQVGYQILSADEFDELDYAAVMVKETSATSEVLNDVGLQYPVSNTIDGKKYTCWQEKENDDGVGQSLSYTFAKEEDIYAISFYNGNVRTEKAFLSHNRLHELQIQTKQSVQLQDVMEEQFVVFDKSVSTEQLKITINSIYAGDGNHNTCLSEIRFYTRS